MEPTEVYSIRYSSVDTMPEHTPLFVGKRGDTADDRVLFGCYEFIVSEAAAKESRGQIPMGARVLKYEII